MAINKEKFLDKLLAMGCSGADLKMFRQMLDDDDDSEADDQLDEPGNMLPRGANDMRLAMDGSFRDLQIAQEIVRPHVGQIFANDAASVFKSAIKKLGYADALSSTIPDAGMHSLWKVVIGRHTGQRPRLANDAKQRKGFAERFPDVARIRSLG